MIAIEKVRIQAAGSWLVSRVKFEIICELWVPLAGRFSDGGACDFPTDFHIASNQPVLLDFLPTTRAMHRVLQAKQPSIKLMEGQSNKDAEHVALHLLDMKACTIDHRNHCWWRRHSKLKLICHIVDRVGSECNQWNQQWCQSLDALGLGHFLSCDHDAIHRKKQ